MYLALGWKPEEDDHGWTYSTKTQNLNSLLDYDLGKLDEVAMKFTYDGPGSTLRIQIEDQQWQGSLPPGQYYPVLFIAVGTDW